MFTVSIKGEAAISGAIQSFKDKIGPKSLKRLASAAGVQVWKRHLQSKYTGRLNKLGGPSTGYWRKVYDSVHPVETSAGVDIIASGTGLKQKFYGGTVVPSGRASEVTGKPIRNLTIPVNPRAHGKSIKDLGGKAKFYIVPLYGGGYNSTAGVFFRSGRTSGKRRSDPLYYVLKKRVTIKLDIDIVPSSADVLNDFEKRLKQFLKSP